MTYVLVERLVTPLLKKTMKGNDMETNEITVVVEKVAHDAMRELAQAIWDKHGVCVRSVRFSWLDVSSLAEQRLLVKDVDADTLAKGF